MARRIVWTLSAQKDRFDILKYWSKRNGNNLYSRSLNDSFVKSVNLIVRFPKLGRELNLKDLHVKVLLNFAIIYRVTKDEIQIIRIWDSRQNPKLLQF